MAQTATPPIDLDLSDPKTQAMKSRVLTHMTNDHRESLALYLRYYSRLPASSAPLPLPSTAPKIELSDIALDHIVVSHPAGRNLIPIDPPMSSLTEARTRLVEMHKNALSGLGLSEIKVNKVVTPNKAWQWITHIATFLCFTTFPFWPAEAFLPGSRSVVSKIWSFGGLAPWYATLAARVKDWVLVIMLIIHVGEVAYFASTRLKRHWVPRFSAVWWAWCGLVFNGGVAAIFRFDDMVGEMEEKAKAEKH